MNAISPLDGRYADQLAPLRARFSEAALMRSRCLVELRYLLALEGTGQVETLAPSEQRAVEEAIARCSPGADFEDFSPWFSSIKEIESTVRHDVKSVEIFLAQTLGLSRPELVHLGLTSEDTNNLAYSLLLADFSAREQLPQLRRLMARLAELVERWAGAPFPTRTHGQPASPSTAGKELAVFLDRLLRQYANLSKLRFRGKLAGATGTYAAWMAAFPAHDACAFAERFVSSLGLVPSLVCTQVEDHDAWAEYFHASIRVNSVVIDLDRDLWEYISRGWFRQRPVSGEVGSSTMPHKINPIQFENSEGNLAIANTELSFLAERLCTSRMQRDLSDSTIERNIGAALAHGFLAIEQTLRGLERIDLDAGACLADLSSTPEVLAEAYQVTMRAAGHADAYDRLKRATRGRQVERRDLDETLDGLDLPEGTRERLSSASPSSYTGAASRVCEFVLARYRDEVAP
jgi:adenylosuccinate lyase